MHLIWFIKSSTSERVTPKSKFLTTCVELNKWVTLNTNCWTIGLKGLSTRKQWSPTNRNVQQIFQCLPCGYELSLVMIKTVQSSFRISILLQLSPLPLLVPTDTQHDHNADKTEWASYGDCHNNSTQPLHLLRQNSCRKKYLLVPGTQGLVLAVMYESIPTAIIPAPGIWLQFSSA